MSPRTSASGFGSSRATPLMSGAGIIHTNVTPGSEEERTAPHEAENSDIASSPDVLMTYACRNFLGGFKFDRTPFELSTYACRNFLGVLESAIVEDAASTGWGEFGGSSAHAELGDNAG